MLQICTQRNKLPQRNISKWPPKVRCFFYYPVVSCQLPNDDVFRNISNNTFSKFHFLAYLAKSLWKSVMTMTYFLPMFYVYTKLAPQIYSQIYSKYNIGTCGLYLYVMFMFCLGPLWKYESYVFKKGYHWCIHICYSTWF